MKKPNNKSTKESFTVTEVGTLIEQLRSEFSVVGEKVEELGDKVEGLTEKLDVTYAQVGKNTEAIELVKTAVTNMSIKIEKLTESIEKLIKTKVDREDFQILEKRISILETKLASLTR